MKLFAIVLSLSLLFTNLGVRTDGKGYAPNLYSDEICTKSPNFELKTEQSTDVNLSLALASSDSSEVVENGKLTLELLSQMSSWDELVKTAIPISGSYRNIENKEDLYCVWLIESLNDKHLSVPVYHDEMYIAYGLGGMDLEEIDVQRMMSKFRTIIDIYNHFNDLYLMWDYDILNERYLSIDVHSTNYIWMCNPAREVGQRVIVRPGAKYFESAWGDGSGKFGVVKFPDTFDIGNDIFPESSIFTVNGVAYLDENWECVLESYYTPYSELGENEPEVSIWERRMLHICTENGDYGWIHAEDVMRIDDVNLF